MPPEYMLQFVQRRPFEPFRICLDDSTVHEIRHPELAMPGNRAIIVGVPKVPSQPLFDRFETLALLHVTPPGATGEGNSSERRRAVEWQALRRPE